MNTLQPCHKWTRKTRSFQVSDIVFVCNETTPPGYWPLGKVIESSPDRDGISDTSASKRQNQSTFVQESNWSLWMNVVSYSNSIVVILYYSVFGRNAFFLFNVTDNFISVVYRSR